MAKKSREGYEGGTADIAELGGQLKALREAQGLSYDDVANATKVRPYLLKAIEDGSIEKISAPIYARGFVKTYCECLLADDLWRKYSRRLKSPDTIKPAKEGGSVDINHPTPMFRRSSIIWVYVLLVFAVIGAAFLLWSQKKGQEGFEHGFFLRTREGDGTVPPEAGASHDVPVAIAGVTSQDLAAVPIPRASMSHDSANVSMSGDPAPVSADLSWMGVDITALSGEPRVPSVRQMASRQELLIEIKGKRTRLVVNQGGKNVTTRELTSGDSRTYYVNSDTEVRLGAGDAADITWFGKKYERVGNGGGPLSMIFYPDGSVKTTSGRSDFFGPERQMSQ
jgi:cytoskeletal protein RodZ